MEDLADRWDTPAAVREIAPGTWDSGMGRTGSMSRPWPSRRRLLQAVRVAASLVRGATKENARRRYAYVAIHGTPKPRLEFQGSDGYLKKQWRLIAKGELGYIPAKHKKIGTGRMKKR